MIDGMKALFMPGSAVPEKPYTVDQLFATKLIQEALGIESHEVVNYVFPKTWPEDREQRARIIGEWLQTEARFLA